MSFVWPYMNCLGLSQRTGDWTWETKACSISNALMLGHEKRREGTEWSVNASLFFQWNRVS